MIILQIVMMMILCLLPSTKAWHIIQPKSIYGLLLAMMRCTFSIFQYREYETEKATSDGKVSGAQSNIYDSI